MSIVIHKKFWHERMVPIHKLRTSNIFFATNSLKLAQKKYLKYEIYRLAMRARAKFFCELLCSLEKFL